MNIERKFPRGWMPQAWPSRQAIIISMVAPTLLGACLRAGEQVAASEKSRPIPWLPEGGVAECQFLPRTAIPLLAMGVRRVDDDAALRDQRLLELWQRPGSAGPGVQPLARVPLFRPYFVYDQQTADGVTWHLLGSEYAGKPLGWADGRQLQLLESRYGYHFVNPDRVPPGVQLYGSRKAAYDALEAQSRVPPEQLDKDVVVAERLQETEEWNPLAEDGIPPFIELSDDEDIAVSVAAGHTDTTPTFPFPAENHLIRVGAVAGGPVDRTEIDRKKKATQVRAGIAIVFVIDETASMKNVFREVAEIIDKNLDLGQDAVNVRVAVSWYSDIDKPGDKPYEVQPLQPLNGPGMDAAGVQAAKARIVADVRGHEAKDFWELGDQPGELIYRGLIAAIEGAGFAADENAMVFVIGDAADRSEQDELLKQEFANLRQRLGKLLERHSLQLAFVQVGEVAEVGTGFADQAKAFQASLSPDLKKRVLVQGAGSETLRNRIADLQSQMDRQRIELLGEIAEMETRNRYSEPGPALLQQLTDQGLERTAFDQLHMQFFVPAWGWRYHPQQPYATPQLRELVLLAKPESDALMPALELAADGLAEQRKIDVDATRERLADVLAQRSKHTRIARAIEGAWEAIPEVDRTLGRFLESGMGLRVRNPLLFHLGTVNPEAGPTSRGIKDLRQSRERIGNARKNGVMWADAWLVLP